jgi:hypothetical protein
VREQRRTKGEPHVTSTSGAAGQRTESGRHFLKFPIGENGKHVNEGPPPPHPTGRLTEQQLIAITIMLAGRPIADVAHGAGVDRRTIYNWRHHHAAFRAELERRRSDVWDETADRIRALLDPAVRMLEEQIRSRYDQDRYRAARTILRLAKVGSAIAVKQPEEGGDEGDDAAAASA